MLYGLQFTMVKPDTLTTFVVIALPGVMLAHSKYGIHYWANYRRINALTPSIGRAERWD